MEENELCEKNSKTSDSLQKVCALPEILPCPISWKYDKEWQAQYEKQHDDKYQCHLNKICKHSSAHAKIMEFICQWGEFALTQIKKQNLTIKQIADGTVDPVHFRPNDLSVQNRYNATAWDYIAEYRDELFAMYNASLAPADILQILQEIDNLCANGRSHHHAILRFIANAKEGAALHKSSQQKELLLRNGKWDAIDEKHSKVKEGFIYVLSNPLMSGILKIGFTASNPDKRAKDVSQQYGLPTSFTVACYWRTKDPYIVEQRIHERLAACNKGGEFFEVSLEVAKNTIENCLLVEGCSNESLGLE